MPFDARDQAGLALADEIKRASADMLLRLEQLMLSAPLHAAEVNKNARARSIGDKTLLDRIDMRFMVLDAMDYILDAMVLRQGTREKDLVSHLCARVLSQASDAWEDDQQTIAQATIDALRNNDGRKFSEKVWDGASHRLVEFHLVVPFETARTRAQGRTRPDHQPAKFDPKKDPRRAARCASQERQLR